jgi:hypothetical protein
MTTPIPTPFDIIDPPPGAFIPSGTMWVVLVLAGIAAFLLARFGGGRGRSHSISSLLNVLLAELNQIRTQVTNQHDLERAARIGRRILSPYLPCDTAGLSSAEMRSLASTLCEQKDDLASSVAEILPLLAAIEDYAYAPSFEQTISTAQATLNSLFDRLEAHVRRHPPA